MKTKEKIINYIKRKIKIIFTSKHAGVILNQPIESDKKDWIGVSTYVDDLATAIDGGARMVAITSDFGSGKSSLISLYKKRYETRALSVHIYPKYVYTINMWETIDGVNAQTKMSVTDLHKSFLFHVINQLSPSKGSYISKRLSKNYGLFSLESSSIFKNVLLGIVIIAFILGEVLRRFGEEVGGIFSFDPEYTQIAMFVAYVICLICMLIVLFRADFIFSSSKSEGKREMDENVLIDYYNKEVLYKKFYHHYIFVIEDLDRIDDMNLVKGFLKEIRKYYLTDKNSRSQFHNNKVTFVINIKPEAMLKNTDDVGIPSFSISKEKLYSKFFDYILILRKINIDNYDSILIGLMKELRNELLGLGLLSYSDEILIENISGMQWIIRGNELGIREIKNRLNSALALYKNLTAKFINKSITFEKCAVATYLIAEYEDDFYKIKDRDIETIIEKYISDDLEEDTSTWGENWENISDGFKRELYNLVVNKMIDSNYRTYFYNYPQGSKLYDLSASIIYNSIIYDERPQNFKEYRKHLDNTPENVIIDAYYKVNQLNLSFPRFIVEFEKLYAIAANHFRQKILDVIGHFQFDSINLSRTSELLEKIVMYNENIEQREDLLIDIADLLNENIDDKENLNLIRQMVCKAVPEDALFFKSLFLGDNSFITCDEIKSIQKIEIIMQLINYLSMNNSFDECVAIHDLIMMYPDNQEKYISFYLKMVLTFGIHEVFILIKEFCLGIDELPSNLRELLVDEVLKSKLSDIEYISLLCSLTRIDADAINSIISIGWIQGLPLKICEQIKTHEEYLFYICNMIDENEDRLDLESPKISDTINENAVWIYKNKEGGWIKIRELVLKSGSLITNYLTLFRREFPKITEEELNFVEDYRNAILILEENDVTEEDVMILARYFNKKYRNPTESFEILQYLSGLNSKVAESLFFELDMKHISYKTMSSKRKNIINAKLTSLFEIENNIKKRINYMRHIGMSIKQLEKNLYVELNKDENLCEEYVNYANSLEKVELDTIENLVHLNSIKLYSDKVNEKLYEMKYYPQYVSSKTASMDKFEIEEDRKEVLWKTYKDMFNNPGYTRTKKYMLKNESFLNLLVKDNAYLESENQLMAYSAANQTETLIKYVVKSFDENDLCTYFSKIIGFDSYESAKYYVEMIIRNNTLLKDNSVYMNTHDKLIDPGLKAKYTKARNKLLNNN